MEMPELDHGSESPEPVQEVAIARATTLSLPGDAAPGEGYVVLPGGEIWTGSADAALELQQRIVSGRAKGG